MAIGKKRPSAIGDAQEALKDLKKNGLRLWYFVSKFVDIGNFLELGANNTCLSPFHDITVLQLSIS